MICTSCGRSVPALAQGCPGCGAMFAQSTVASAAFPIDTTGLPPGATFGAFTGLDTGQPLDPDGVVGTTLGAATGPLRVGQSFSPRYHIIKVLGVGGMGAVYQAWDAELGVAVALKVIRTDARRREVASEAEKRFKQELLLARQVTHKNVVRIHDLGEIDGIKYITMPYIKGDDLATVLRRDGRLPIVRAMKLARQIAGGLAAAHEAGVVHRDLKPANIMIGAEDLALIMDFGISASSDEAGSGGIVGTLEYMAPEQGTGIAVDRRADIYALGMILYEMLLGPRPTTATTARERIEAMKQRAKEGLPPARTIDPAIPGALDAMVTRCLERDPAARYQTTGDLEGDLNRLDENGEPIPVKRVIGMRSLAAVVSLALALLGGSWWYARTLIPPVQHEPVVVMIADFQNTTGDRAFEHALEPMLRRALESAGFISAYDRSRIRATFGVIPPDRLDEAAARELALKQGVAVVVSGAIDRRGDGYDISVKAAQTVTGKVVASARGRAANKDGVVGVATKLVTTVRKALGDETSDSAQLLAMKSLSTTSMAVATQYAAAIEAQSNNKFDDARQHVLKAVELDPNFGLGYQGLALMSRNLGKLQDAEAYTTEALRHLQGMTERERFAVRGSYYMVTGDSQQCVKEYGDLIAQYAADAVAHNNRALCLSKLRKMGEAVDEMRRASRILPRRVAFRGNLAVYADYAGDFKTAEQEAGALQQPTDLAVLASAFAQLGQGLLPQAATAYQKLGTIGPRGASWAASGLGDLALFEGRFSDAVTLFEQGAASDLASGNADKAARKFTSLAYAHLMRGQKDAAIAAAGKALASNASSIRFLAARVLVEANAIARARTLAAGLSSELPAEAQAYGKIIEGEIALKSGDARQAIRILTEANSGLDSWLGHFDLGRAYLEAGAFPQADSEFERCIKRRGEALSLLVDEEPSYGYFPIVYYYQGRVREGLKNAASADSYREYLKVRGKSTEDPFLPDVRRRTVRD